MQFNRLCLFSHPHVQHFNAKRERHCKIDIAFFDMASVYGLQSFKEEAESNNEQKRKLQHFQCWVLVNKSGDFF
jgi:hypothetical protein